MPNVNSSKEATSELNMKSQHKMKGTNCSVIVTNFFTPVYNATQLRIVSFYSLEAAEREQSKNSTMDIMENAGGNNNN